MTREDFEKVVLEVYELLPPQFKEAFENIGIIVEDYPGDEIVRKMKLRSKHDLLGLYEGIPLTRRGTSYGMFPSAPDKITIYQANIERLCKNDEELHLKIKDVVIHEIGHYFGMSEEEVRAAGY